MAINEVNFISGFGTKEMPFYPPTELPLYVWVVDYQDRLLGLMKGPFVKKGEYQNFWYPDEQPISHVIYLEWIVWGHLRVVKNWRQDEEHWLDTWYALRCPSHVDPALLPRIKEFR